MTDTDVAAHAAQTRLNQGLRNLWHPVLPSWGLRDAPKGLTRLGQNIVLWRDENGGVRAIEDRCPHRGARLSLGWNLGDRIGCWYHGIEVDGTGTVVKVPAVTSCPLEGRDCVRAYPVREVAGAIFVYFAAQSDDATPVPALDLPEQLTAPHYSHFLCTAQWDCNYRYAIDNVMDPMHGSYLHAKSHSMASGDKQAEMELKKTEHGLYFGKVGQLGVNFDWVEFGVTNAVWMRLTIPYQKKFGPGGPFGIIGFVTPVDEAHCRVFFWRYRKVEGWQRDAWRFLYKTRLEQLHWTVLEQDRAMLEDMAPDAREYEFLYQHDVGMARVRRLMLKMARSQGEAASGAAN